MKPTQMISNHKSHFNNVTRHKFTIVSGHKSEGITANCPITKEEPLYKCIPDGKFLLVIVPKLSLPILPSLPKLEALNAN